MYNITQGIVKTVHGYILINKCDVLVFYDIDGLCFKFLWDALTNTKQTSEVEYMILLIHN